jgi:AcrR family transcriptional regulator
MPDQGSQTVAIGSPGRVPREARRKQLLEAALRALERLGPDISMEEIAAEGGVTKPILYRHFGDREGLAAALSQLYLDELLVEMAAHRDPDLRVQTAAQLDAGIRVLERHPGLYQYITRQRGFATAQERGEMPPVLQSFAAFLREILAARGLSQEAAEPWAHALAGMFHGSTLWWLEARSLPRERFVAYITDLLWDGLENLLGSSKR